MTSKRNQVWLPLIATLPESPIEIFFNHLRSHYLQQHPSLIVDECLHRAAIVRAYQISLEWGHCFQDDCVNRIVRRICPLPAEYSENGNGIESIIGGVRNPISALNFLLASPSHADHLLGRTPFFKEQTRVGIAFLDDASKPYHYYYVILISK